MSQNDIPADAASRESLAARGLDYRVIDTDDHAAFAHTVRAIGRGFLGPEPSDEAIAEQRSDTAHRRYVGVFDPATAQADVPVGTVDSWLSPLTVPGGELEMWAISGVTVAGTHRRRGIARAMLEGELRAAAGAGLAIAGLTVTETTIYGRYGFGPAVPMSSWRIDTRRAGWAGHEVPGRVEFVDREQLAQDLAEVHERARRQRAGEVAGWTRRWRELAGLSVRAQDGDRVRGVRYLDADGTVRGAMAYRVTEGEEDFSRARLAIRHLAAETPDAAAALWRFALQHDLVVEVTAELRAVDDPVRWLLHDERGAVQTLRDHGWLRILDLRRALEARSYAAPADVVLRVADPLGLTTGTWRVEVDRAGAARVSATAEEPDLRLGIAELSAVFLGGTPLTGLLAAGRLTGDQEAAAVLDGALRPAQPPRLSIWY